MCGTLGLYSLFSLVSVAFLSLGDYFSGEACFISNLMGENYFSFELPALAGDSP